METPETYDDTGTDVTESFGIRPDDLDMLPKQELASVEWE